VRFLDQYLPPKVAGVGWVSMPVTKTTIISNFGGNESANQDWEHPKLQFLAPEAIARDWEVVQGLMLHWRIMRGPFRTWPIRDPLDFASRHLVKPNQVPTVAMTDQAIGIGDGFTERFQLVKTYTLGAESYVRSILLPVLSTVTVAVDGLVVDPADYTVSRPGGIVQFAIAPEADAVITAGFLFDVNVRFENDDALAPVLRAHHVAGFAEMTLLETRVC
jgi:uncharacterized protein (TIGR02217 family)